ncbi:MAG: lamin tail domain-containing protein [Microscillaceae bacterium]|jgi:hypothetical protein|nr:lamin tail domain-containing protein [Microscillaceae bacterium]
MIQKLIFTLGIFSLHLSLFGQVNDDFSDGNFSANPTWSGDMGSFVVDNGALRSNGANVANSRIYLSTANTLFANTEWNFLLDLRFNPTNTTYVRVYLASNQADVKGNLNGYFIQIGQTNADFIRFFRQDGATTTQIFTGSTSLGSGNIRVRIRVTRLQSGEWEIFSDASGGQNWVSEGAPFIENTYTNTAFLGINCTYATASRFNQYFFDDFRVLPLIIDTEPPSLQSLKVLNVNQLQISFSEAVELASAQNLLNYVVDNQIGNPSAAVLDILDKKNVILTFATDFPSQIQCTLTAQAIQDLAKNQMPPQSLNFTFIRSFAPVYNELIISEIMADPRGSAQPLNPLPEAEFVEVYNRGNRILNLKNCIFSDASNSYILPEILLFPQEYLILIDDSQIADYQGFGKVLGLGSFPSLTNSGELLTLKNANQDLLFAVAYTDEWYQNSSKQDGGWSLEMIDINAPCRDADNWLASVATRGGTPGKVNSVNDTHPDLQAPQVLRALAIDNQTIRVFFDKKMNPQSLNFIENYTLNQNIAIQALTISDPVFYRVLSLQVNPPLQAQTVYQLTLNNVSDCAGNLLPANTQINFGLPEPADSLDIILNEILFNPRTGGSDFVELYNQSNKYINLKDWKIANLDDEIIANQTLITTDNQVIAPQSYLVLSSDIANIQSNYPKSIAQTQPANFLKMSNMPSYNDDEGTFFLINNQGKLMERLDYQDTWHNPLVAVKDGVSLERIGFAVPTNVRSSWQSAAQSQDFATPGYRNSQTLTGIGAGEVSVNPPIFTPNGDGERDFTIINLNLASGGYIINLSIFDREGREIRQLAKNQLGGTQNNFVWDGADENGNRVQTGAYLLYIKALTPTGEQKIWKEKVVVGTRF